MSKKIIRKPLIAAIGAAIITSLSGVPMANADSNPFAATQLSSGYMVADSHGGGGDMKEMGEGKCGEKEMGKGKEGKCGAMGKAKSEGKCGEGKCGGDKKAKKEGKCGEGKCGGDMKAKEGKCGGDKKGKEGKCGGDM